MRSDLLWFRGGGLEPRRCRARLGSGGAAAEGWEGRGQQQTGHLLSRTTTETMKSCQDNL